MIVRALKPNEEYLFRQAYEWTADAPEWWKAMDRVYPVSFGDYHLATFDESQFNFGIFDGEMFGLITVNHYGDGVFDVHIAAKRGASVELLAEAACMIRERLFKSGAQAIFGWVAKFNRGIIKVGEACGMHRDGVRMFKGECHGRVIEWVHLITTRAEWESEIKLAA
jgi:hypothetical protein